MIRDLEFIGSFAVAMIVWTFVVPEFADSVKRFEAWVGAQFKRGVHGERALPGLGTGPLNVAPEHPRHGTLLNDTPPEGTQVTVQGEALTVGEREHAAPDVYERFRQVLAGNGIMPGDLPRTEPLLRALFAPAQAPENPAPSMLPLTGPFPRVHAADLVYGEAPQLAVEQAQRLAAGYDPADDNCAGTPGCGSERVLFKHYGTDMFACPRCYENVFGGPPDPARVFTIAVDEAQRLAEVMQP